MKIGDVTPKLPSTVAFSQTLLESVRLGNSPLLMAVVHAPLMTGQLPGGELFADRYGGGGARIS